MLFGYTQDKQIVHSYELKNHHLKVRILDYGCIIQELLVNNNDNWENVIFAYDNIQDYENLSPYFGCITGRTAGRIKEGKFSLNGQTYILAQNNGCNNLHGGIKGLDKRIWTVESHTEQSIVLTYMSPDGEEGFPGNVEFRVAFKLVDNFLISEVTAVSDKDTPINITNHTYFNLSSGKKSSIDHQLTLDAEYYFPIALSSEICGKKISVQNTPFDFRVPKTISQDINQKSEQLQRGSGYDHCFLLHTGNINLYDPYTKKGLKITTNQQACILYTGNFLTEKMGKNTLGTLIKPREAICLETQNIPDGIKYIVIKSGEIYFNKNKWEFYLD